MTTYKLRDEEIRRLFFEENKTEEEITGQPFTYTTQKTVRMPSKGAIRQILRTDERWIPRRTKTAKGPNRYKIVSQAIVMLRDKNCTLKEISEQIGLTSERIRQIEARQRLINDSYDQQSPH